MVAGIVKTIDPVREELTASSSSYFAVAFPRRNRGMFDDGNEAVSGFGKWGGRAAGWN